MSQQPEGSGVHQRSAHPLYDELHATAEFVELRKKFRGFVIPATIAFMVWYLLYVVMSNWAPGFMGTEVIGNVNVALVFGFLQFLTTFLIAWLYGKHMASHVDPIARKLEQRYVDESGSHGSTGGRA